MVKGLDKYREAFAHFSDNYVIIGGTACDVILSQTDMRPRVTDDIDMILVVEKVTAEFVSAFWQFIKKVNTKTGNASEAIINLPFMSFIVLKGGERDTPPRLNCFQNILICWVILPDFILSQSSLRRVYQAFQPSFWMMITIPLQ